MVKKGLRGQGRAFALEASCDAAIVAGGWVGLSSTSDIVGDPLGAGDGTRAAVSDSTQD